MSRLGGRSEGRGYYPALTCTFASDRQTDRPTFKPLTCTFTNPLSELERTDAWCSTLHGS